MKEWVIGSPYTTETVLDTFDTTLIIACDGVCFTFFYLTKLNSYQTPIIIAPIDMGCLP